MPTMLLVDDAPTTRTLLTAWLPVVVLTTSDLDRDMAESYSVGANSYVSKPVATDEFLEAARMLGVYWLGINKRANRETLTTPTPAGMTLRAR